MDLYEILGVSRAARADEIKAAFRRRAKSAHPDISGGDRETFEQLQDAYAVLSDPTARAHYDATGEILGRDADNAHVPALACLTAAFGAVINDIAKRRADPKKSDVIDLMRRHIAPETKQRADERTVAERNRPLWNDLRDRFTAEDGKPNVLAAIVNARIAAIDRVARDYEHQDVVAEAALKILADHRYRFDIEPRPPWHLDQMSTAGLFGNGGLGA